MQTYRSWCWWTIFHWW